jgi:ectoine hydroxylase-related dioxygenase (phytanoyl-CoA dioxygenase family)
MKLSIPDNERQAEWFSDDTVTTAGRQFADRGTLLIESVFPRELIQSLQDAFSNYVALGETELGRSSMTVGNKRLMVSIEVAPPFSDPRVFASTKVMQILNALLGQDVVLNSYGAVCAFPGSQQQHIHRDHDPLFRNGRIDMWLPPHAVTVVIPLVDIDLNCGTTAVWEGSHRAQNATEVLRQLKQTGDLTHATLPTPKMGDCYLMDYRLVHAGTANNSDRSRTIMYLVYSRAWFRDTANFKGQPSINITRDELERVPGKFRDLFRYAVPRDSAVASAASY